MRREIVEKFAKLFGETKEAASAGDLLLKPKPLEEPVNLLAKDSANTTMDIPGFSMAPKLRLREGRTEITPALAKQILDECNYSRQRPVRIGHVHALANMMHRRRFTDGTQLHFARLNDRLVLVNGQHRLHAVVEAAVSVEFQLLITDVTTEEQVGQIYYRHDTVAGIRSAFDVMRAANAAEKYGLSDSEITRVISACKLIAVGFANLNGHTKASEFRSPDTQFELAHSWWPHARNFLGHVSDAEKFVKARIMSQGVLSVGLLTCRYQSERAKEFWIGTAEDDGLRRGDPRKTLINHLIENPVGGGTRALHTARATATAWNAFFEQRSITFIRVNMGTPVTIAGTPVGRSRRKSA